jgi:hypothetical protein
MRYLAFLDHLRREISTDNNFCDALMRLKLARFDRIRLDQLYHYFYSECRESRTELELYRLLTTFLRTHSEISAIQAKSRLHTHTQ